MFVFMLGLNLSVKCISLPARLSTNAKPRKKIHESEWSESDFGGVNTKQKKKTYNSSTPGNAGKRKSCTTSTNSRKKSKSSSSVDVFGISHGQVNDEDCSSQVLSSYFVNKVANGYERRSSKATGNFYVDLKVYRSADARDTEALELWKKALVRIKFGTDEDSNQWRKLQALVQSVDKMFEEPPKFFSYV